MTFGYSDTTVEILGLKEDPVWVSHWKSSVWAHVRWFY